MRLWSLHPRYLDARGLTACWREALLARAVLEGKTAGYHRHPQLDRFKTAADPLAAINRYLREVYEEAMQRGYHFDIKKLREATVTPALSVTEGQLSYEWARLRAKLKIRNPAYLRKITGPGRPLAHPLFSVVPGPIASWERGHK